MVSTIDDVFKRIGEFQRFQWRLLAIIGYSVTCLAAFPIMIVSFITAEPDWKCVDGYMNNTVCRFNKSITLTSDDYKARCKMPREAWMFVDDFTSAVTEYNLVCDRSILLSVAQSCFWIGWFLALLVGGASSDKFGRRKIWYGSCIVILVATWIMVFPKYFVVFIVCRVFIGLGSGFRNCTSFPLLTEFTSDKYRSWMGIIGSFLFWSLGSSTLPLIGYLVPAWRMFLFVTAVAAVPVLINWWFVPESPRWLLLNDKDEEAKALLAKVAKVNKRPLPDNLLLKKLLIAETRGSYRQLFSSWSVAKKVLISWNLWFANALVYYGVSYGAVDLGGNRYLNVFLISVVEIPSGFAVIWSINRFGRKKSVIIPMVIAFIASAISVSIPTSKSVVSVGGRVASAIVAKFAINFSFCGIYVWCVELFPTTVRSTALATSSAAARIGSFSSSYIIWLVRIYAFLPYGIMGGVCLQAAVLAVFLPETNGTPTLETMADMKNDESDALLVSSGDNDDISENDA